MKQEKVYTSPYDMEGKIPLKQAVPLGLQHVLAMFVGNLTPLILITGGAGCAINDPKLLVTLLQNAMVMAGASRCFRFLQPIRSAQNFRS